MNQRPKTEDWKRFEKNKSAISLNILYIKEKEICPAFISKNNSSWEKNNYYNDS